MQGLTKFGLRLALGVATTAFISVSAATNASALCESIGMVEAPTGFVAEGFIRHGKQLVANDIGHYYSKANGSPTLCVKNPLGTVTEQWLCNENCTDGSHAYKKCKRDVAVYGEVVRIESVARRD